LSDGLDIVVREEVEETHLQFVGDEEAAGTVWESVDVPEVWRRRVGERRGGGSKKVVAVQKKECWRHLPSMPTVTKG
jgi:hypothetical protein